MYCSQCGQIVVGTMRFCLSCGSPIAITQKITTAAFLESPSAKIMDTSTETVNHPETYLAIANLIKSAVDQIVLPFDQATNEFSRTPEFNANAFFRQFFIYADKFTDQCCQELANLLRKHSVLAEVRGSPTINIAKQIREGVFGRLDAVLAEYVKIIKNVQIELDNVSATGSAIHGAAVGRVIAGFGKSGDKGAFYGALLGAASAADQKTKLEIDVLKTGFAQITKYLEEVTRIPGNLIDYTSAKLFGDRVNFELQKTAQAIISNSVTENMTRCGSIAEKFAAYQGARIVIDDTRFPKIFGWGCILLCVLFAMVAGFGVGLVFFCTWGIIGLFFLVPACRKESKARELMDDVQGRLIHAMPTNSLDHSVHVKPVSDPPCPNCGLPESGKFCRKCGTRITSSSDSQASPDAAVLPASQPSSPQVWKSIFDRTLYRASKRGNIDDQYRVAVMFDHGKETAPDLAAASKWYRQAADQGHRDAQFKIAVMYEKGEGVSKDLSVAFDLYRRAGEQGHQQAQFRLWHLYKFGMGVEKNGKEAARWLKLAADGGHPHANILSKDMAGRPSDG